MTANERAFERSSVSHIDDALAWLATSDSAIEGPRALFTRPYPWNPRWF